MGSHIWEFPPWVGAGNQLPGGGASHLKSGVPRTMDKEAGKKRKKIIASNEKNANNDFVNNSALSAFGI